MRTSERCDSPVRMDSGEVRHSSMVFMSWARASCTCRPCRSSFMGMSFRPLFLHRRQLTFRHCRAAYIYEIALPVATCKPQHAQLQDVLLRAEHLA